VTPRLRVLIADDEPLARRRLRALLAPHEDFEIIGECANGAEVLAGVERHRPDVMFLDIQMPMIDGVAVARATRGTKLPVVVFVTAHDDFAVDAFDLDAVDYLLKPYDEERFLRTLGRVRDELIADAVPRAGTAVVRHGDIELNVAMREVRRAGQPIVLRRKEYEVFVRLLERVGEVIARRELLNDVWGYKDDVVSRTLDTHVCELRRKLGHEPHETGYIETIPGVGYRMTTAGVRPRSSPG